MLEIISAVSNNDVFNRDEKYKSEQKAQIKRRYIWQILNSDA